MTIPFVKYSKFWLFVSAGLAVLGIAAIATWGLKWGIDFTGGSLMDLTFTGARPENTAVVAALEEVGVSNALVQKSGDNGLIVRTATMTEESHQKALATIKKEFETKDNVISEPSFEMIGPSVSQQLRQRSLWAIILVCIGIMIYIAYAFRAVTRPVPSWKYGALAIIAMLHDVVIVIGIFSVLGHFAGVEVDTTFVVAVLTILGFSVHDTIVVYDRIREKLLHRGQSQTLEEIVDSGLNQTLGRSINTTVTVMITLFAMYFFGGASIHNFVLALLIGFVAGAYSSIFIASPLLVYVERWQRRNLTAKKA
ncbi:MAG: protein translocase subunit SecF [Patescibacteria group bacterium]